MECLETMFQCLTYAVIAAVTIAQQTLLAWRLITKKTREREDEKYLKAVFYSRYIKKRFFLPYISLSLPHKSRVTID